MQDNTRPGAGSIAVVAALIATTAAAMFSGEVFAAGDPVRGKARSVECFGCHGEDGNSRSPVNPKIGGQHEQYLLLALKAYADGSRANSLMRGAVLNKSEQDLEDIAAYFASRKPAAAPPPGARPPRRPAPVRFDQGERLAQFAAMLARARHLVPAAPPPLDPSACARLAGTAEAGSDTDGDGVPDMADAKPSDASGFAADANADGFVEICNAWQLQAIATGHPKGAPADQKYQLAADIDASLVRDFEPIGNCGPTGNCMRALGRFGFPGVFDGRGHAIRNLTVSRPERGGVGLFGVLAETGIVANVVLENVRVAGRAGTGALVGSNFGVLMSSSVSGEVDAAMAVGGAVGGSGGLVYDCAAEGRVTGRQAVGGLVGDMTGAVFHGTATTRVSGERGVGGLVGLNTSGSVVDSTAGGEVSGENDVGGLVGVNTDARIRNSSTSGAVRGEASNIGGLVGFNSLSSVRNTFARGSVSGADAVGGLIGRNNGTVSRSYATGRVMSDGAAGELVGVNLDDAKVGDSFTAGTRADARARATDPADPAAWSPAGLPAARLLAYFCDTNGNAYIDPDERVPENYIWAVHSPAALPVLRCTGARAPR